MTYRAHPSGFYVESRPTTQVETAHTLKAQQRTAGAGAMARPEKDTTRVFCSGREGLISCPFGQRQLIPRDVHGRQSAHQRDKNMQIITNGEGQNRQRNAKTGCPGCPRSDGETQGPLTLRETTATPTDLECPGCPGCLFDQPGHRNGGERVSTGCLGGVSRLSRLDSNLLHTRTHTCVRPPAPSINDSNSRDSRDTLTYLADFGCVSGSIGVEGVPAGFPPSRDTRDTAVAVTGGGFDD